jgi:hypothetical protein
MHIDCFSNPNNQRVDVIISTLPWTESSIPLGAPAGLKPHVERAGLSCRTADFNVEICNLVKAHPQRDHLINFFFNGVGHESIDPWLEDMFSSAAKGILSWNPRYVALSFFSYVSRAAGEWLCYYIKKMSPSTCIIVGGAGCLEQFTGPGYFADDLRERKLIDYHIRGDGENALYELLLGNTSYPGINSLHWKELTGKELEQLSYPDYTNYDFSSYDKKMLGIHGSRGCVRACTFCDYIANWTKFNWRSGQNIFNEMKMQYKKYGIRTFKFHDTLTNGNLKEFNKLINLLSEHNENYPSQSFRWGGYYIFREQSANDDEMWSTLAKSGADFLSVGIENLNEDLRYHIGKKFSNASIDYHLAQAQKHNIRLELLCIVGYVLETQEHIEFSKQWLRTHTQYKDNVIIQWGGTLGIFPNTYLSNNKEKLGIIMIGDQPNAWINQSIGSTPALRSKWTQELNELSVELGYKIFNDLDNHFILEQLINVEH